MYTTDQQTNTMNAIITEHNTTDNAIIQHFGDRTVRIVTDITTGKTGVFINENLRNVHQSLTITEYESLQVSAFLAWNKLIQIRS